MKTTTTPDGTMTTMELETTEPETDWRERAKALLRLAETGSEEKQYDALTILKDYRRSDGAMGHQVTFGYFQATGGALASVIRYYREEAKAAIDEDVLDGPEVRVHLVKELAKYDVHGSIDTWCWSPMDDRETLAEDSEFHALLLKAARHDPAMKRAQDRVHDEMFWQPAMRQADRMGLVHPLSKLVVYDSVIQGGLAIVRQRFAEKPPATGGVERTDHESGMRGWTTAYCEARALWLESRGGLLANTIYRPVAWLRIAADGNWDLVHPVQFLGKVV